MAKQGTVCVQCVCAWKAALKAVCVCARREEKRRIEARTDRHTDTQVWKHAAKMVWLACLLCAVCCVLCEASHGQQRMPRCFV